MFSNLAEFGFCYCSYYLQCIAGSEASHAALPLPCAYWKAGVPKRFAPNAHPTFSLQWAPHIFAREAFSCSFANNKWCLLLLSESFTVGQGWFVVSLIQPQLQLGFCPWDLRIMLSQLYYSSLYYCFSGPWARAVFLPLTQRLVAFAKWYCRWECNM